MYDAPEDKQSLSSSQTVVKLTVSVLLAVVLLGLILVAQRYPVNTEPPPPITEVGPPTAPPTFTPELSATPRPSPTPMPSPTPILVTWQELSSLVTIEFKLQTTVEITVPRRIWFDGKMIYSAVGIVRAGINLAEINVLEQAGTYIKVELPRADLVGGPELLPNESRTWAREWFPGDDVETEALELAKQELENWARTQSDLLGLAETLGKAQIENHLRNLGFSEIEVTFKAN